MDFLKKSNILCMKCKNIFDGRTTGMAIVENLVLCSDCIHQNFVNKFLSIQNRNKLQTQNR